jgi:hypothetical protein
MYRFIYLTKETFSVNIKIFKCGKYFWCGFSPYLFYTGGGLKH